ncbi:hypothetical protein [uncultured Bifidobacterium sp.]|uniref:hypothetical protein n=1 Tax=uncultured Bifidobacterium sp. TaxID=165187 RepID=UPI00262CBDDD|nr:hypothetical protein [uncultured Bifidobacterium sp.]
MELPRTVASGGLAFGEYRSHAVNYKPSLYRGMGKSAVCREKLGIAGVKNGVLHPNPLLLPSLAPDFSSGWMIWLFEWCLDVLISPVAGCFGRMGVC